MSAKHDSQKSCRKEVPSKQNESKKRDLGLCLQRDDTDFPWLCPFDPAVAGAALSQAQQGPSCAQGAAREETTVLSGPQLLLQKDLALLNPHVSKLTTDGHIWVSDGLRLLRFQDMQPSSVLLPDLFLGPGKTVLRSSSD